MTVYLEKLYILPSVYRSNVRPVWIITQSIGTAVVSTGFAPDVLSLSHHSIFAIFVTITINNRRKNGTSH